MMSAGAPTRPLKRKLERLLDSDLSVSLTAFSSMREFKTVHAQIITSGRAHIPFVTARLLAFCAISGDGSLPYADSLFASALRPTFFMYNSIIRGYSQSPDAINSVSYYVRMLRAGIPPNGITFPFLLKSCSALEPRALGRAVHCHAAKFGFDSDVFVANNAIGMYAGWGEMASARQVFDELRCWADVVSWTTIVTGYSNCGDLDSARWFFDRMPERNLVSWNSMIGGYARGGEFKKAYHLFDKMPVKDIASWSSMVSGFAHCGLSGEAFQVFQEMKQRGIAPNEAAVVSTISACAQLRDLSKGELVHGYIVEQGIHVSETLGTVLVDMYGKCGSMEKAVSVFKAMPVKNLYTWNSMITGLAMNGFGKQALMLYWKMISAGGLEPNEITFIGVLSACSHNGLAKEGQRFFHLMTQVHGIRPVKEHYGCMVDLLSRAGCLDEAMDFVEQMPMEPHPGLWGAIAGACSIHGKVELGEEVVGRLMELEPHHGGRYVLLSNIYAAARRWDDMVVVRKLLNEKRAIKIPGNSKVGTPSPVYISSVSSSSWSSSSSSSLV